MAEFLVNNIMTNAIKYNHDGGIVTIRFEKESLIVENSHWNEVPEENLFNRYVRLKDNIQSTGLGLQIVYEICQKHNLSVTYKTNNDNFIIKVFTDSAS